MIKVVASDVDGTLIHELGESISPRLFAQIERLKEKGIYFVVASGRPYANLKRLFVPLEEEIAYISENGSYCVDKDTVFAKGLIEAPLATEILGAIDEIDELVCIVSTDHVMYTSTKHREYTASILKNYDYEVTYVDNLATDIAEPIIKIATFTPGDNFATLEHFKALFGDRIKVVTAGNAWVDFISPIANKGSSLKAYCELKGVKPEECMAFGDQYNDAEMLAFAGESYAMETCAPGVEKYAKHRTALVEDTLDELLNSLK